MTEEGATGTTEAAAPNSNFDTQGLKQRTLAVRLDRICRRASTVGTLRDVVLRAHRIRTDGQRLLLHEVLRCIEQGRQIPALSDKTTVTRFFAAVCAGDQGRSKQLELDTRLRETLASKMPWLRKHDAKNMSVFLEDMAKSFITCLSVQVHRAFRARVARLVKMRCKMADAAYKAMTKKQRRERARWVKLAGTAATATVPGDLPSEFVATVTTVRAELGLDAIEPRLGLESSSKG